MDILNPEEGGDQTTSWNCSVAIEHVSAGTAGKHCHQSMAITVIILLSDLIMGTELTLLMRAACEPNACSSIAQRSLM